MTATGARRIEGAASRFGRAPISLDYLNRQTFGDPGLEGEVLRMFDVMAHTYLDRLGDAEGEEALLTQLHRIKAAAAGVGAFTLSELAREVEVSVNAGEAVDPERIEDLRMALEEVSAFIAQRIDAAAA